MLAALTEDLFLFQQNFFFLTPFTTLIMVSLLCLCMWGKCLLLSFHNSINNEWHCLLAQSIAVITHVFVLILVDSHYSICASKSLYKAMLDLCR